MTPEQRFNRLEENFDILSKLLIESRAQTKSLQAQTKRIDSRTEILIELVRDHDERMQTQLTWINQLGEAQANSDFKLAALADAQIRTEDAQLRTEAKLADLSNAQIGTEAILAKLSNAQLITEAKLAELGHAQLITEGKLAELSDAQIRTEAKFAELSDAQLRTEESLARLAEAQAHSDRRVNDLIDVVQRRRGDGS